MPRWNCPLQLAAKCSWVRGAQQIYWHTWQAGVYANIEGIEAIVAGRLPRFYAYHDRDWATFNAGLVARHRTESFDGMIASAEHSLAKLVSSARAVPAEDFSRHTGLRFKGWRVTVASILQAPARDEVEHRRQIMQFAARQETASASDLPY